MLTYLAYLLTYIPTYLQLSEAQISVRFLQPFNRKVLLCTTVD